jgi:hypothetical protein
MGVINFIDSLYNNNKFRCQKHDKSFIAFSTLNYYYKVNFSNQITKQIWLGNYAESANENFIKKNNIKVIINCSKDLKFYFDQNEVPYKYRIPVDDDRQDNSLYIMYLYLPKIVDIMKFHINRGENIYVHCHAGMQRSACVVAAYLMSSFNMTPKDAITIIKRNRPIAFTPFVNFEKALINYSNTIEKERIH